MANSSKPYVIRVRVPRFQGASATGDGCFLQRTGRGLTVELAKYRLKRMVDPGLLEKPMIIHR